MPWAAISLAVGWDVVTVTEALEPVASRGVQGTHVPRGSRRTESVSVAIYCFICYKAGEIMS